MMIPRAQDKLSLLYFEYLWLYGSALILGILTDILYAISTEQRQGGFQDVRPTAMHTRSCPLAPSLTTLRSPNGKILHLLE
jgi:uncharacterized membrane protein